MNIETYVSNRYPLFENFMQTLWNQMMSTMYQSELDALSDYKECSSVSQVRGFVKELQDILCDDVMQKYLISKRGRMELAAALRGGMMISNDELRLILKFLK